MEHLQHELFDCSELFAYLSQTRKSILFCPVLWTLFHVHLVVAQPDLCVVLQGFIWAEVLFYLFIGAHNKQRRPSLLGVLLLFPLLNFSPLLVHVMHEELPPVQAPIP